jgi:hypothetical protein
VVLLLAFLLAGALRQLGLLQLRLGDDPGALRSLLVLPLAALLVGNLAAAVAIMTVYGASRALAVVAAVSMAGDDFPATCDVIQNRLFSLKALVGAAALLLAAAIVIF